MKITSPFVTLCAIGAFVLVSSCGSNPPAGAASPEAGPDSARSEGQARRGGGGPGQSSDPKPYDEVITDKAVSDTGYFTTHRIDEQLFFEIPRAALDVEMLMLPRQAETSRSTGFFGGGGSRVVVWQRRGNKTTLREHSYDVIADSSTAIRRAVDRMNKGPIVAAFDVAAFGPDSAVVIDVTSLFTTANADMGSLQSVQRDRSFIEWVAAFPDNVEVEATQTASQRRPGAPPTVPPETVTALMHWSFMRLPADPMMPRLHDKRVGFISFTSVDYGRPEHRAETRRFIRRFRLEKQNPSEAVSDPVEPIVYWIDPATPEWLKPWVKQGVDAWQEAFEDAGFSNAISGRYAPTTDEDPDWSLYDLRHSVIYWRPSEIPNATGGQIYDPRSGEILKGEVNMYHNVMNLLRNWYFIQVGPLDPRAQNLPLPDSLMGRLVEYVVTHEIGHSIGFPHNMKASSQYPADSVRSATFLRRMGGHVATLMDYSRFNYVAQPEDNIPVNLLIPNIGPYDRFAVRWGYRPIPEAHTPDEEWDTLDRWSRVQDTIPWFRFSTSDATNDPGNLTEAVGDENAVYSSGLALRNLHRVMDMLIDVAERPGQDYELLEELYQNAVSQWGRYMGHVAAVIAGAETQEKYGTGERFQPVSRARQQEAMRFLGENAFDTPDYFIDPVILRRIEAEGIIPRIRAGQASVLRTLINTTRLNRLVEYEALAGSADRAYTVADLMSDLRSGVWGELSNTPVSIDVYRRNLQRAYLETIDAELNPPEADDDDGPSFIPPQFRRPTYASDARPILRGELSELDAAVEQAIGRAGDSMTRLHLRDVRMEIERILHPNGT